MDRPTAPMAVVKDVSSVHTSCKDKNLSAILGIECASAVLASALVAPAISIIDKSIISTASGNSPSIFHAVRSGFTKLVTQPLHFCRQPAFLMIWGVYAGTYVVGNSIEALCDWQKRAAFYPKFIGSSMANVGLSVAKDRAFTRMFGKGSAKPLPIPSYMLFGARDSLTILAGFSLPPIISKEFIQPVFHIPKKTADVISQLTVPCVMQFISTPLHLLGLHLYNYRQSDGASRLANIRHFYWGTAFARIGRIFPAFGIGGVVNRQLRETLKEKYT